MFKVIFIHPTGDVKLNGVNTSEKQAQAAFGTAATLLGLLKTINGILIIWDCKRNRTIQTQGFGVNLDYVNNILQNSSELTSRCILAK